MDMDDSPEVVKMLKYILFGIIIILTVPGIPGCLGLVNEPVPHPFTNDFPPSHMMMMMGPPPPVHHNQRDPLFHNHYGGPFPPLKLHPQFLKNPNDIIMKEGSITSSREEEEEHGGPPGDHQGRMRRPPRRDRDPHLLEKLGGSLCSIFRSFLDSGRFRRCRVSDGDGEQGNNKPRHRPRSIGHYHHNPRKSMSGESHPDHHPQPPLLLMDHRRLQGIPPNSNNNPMDPPGRMSLPVPPGMRQVQDNTRIDLQNINHSGEELGEDDDEGGNGGRELEEPRHPDEDMDPRGNPDPTKISQDRTMILVPERNCPQGQRRDARGYCRRLVKIKTNYQYGPPPPLPRPSPPSQQGDNGNNNGNNQNQQVVRPIPIRYYYSRVVSIPAFQLLFPNVSV